MRFGDDVVENVVYIVGWCIKKFFCEGVVICCFDVYLIGFFVVRQFWDGYWEVVEFVYFVVVQFRYGYFEIGRYIVVFQVEDEVVFFVVIVICCIGKYGFDVVFWIVKWGFYGCFCRLILFVWISKQVQGCFIVFKWLYGQW